MHLDLASDGTGWMWGAQSPLLATADGGVTWAPMSIADALLLRGLRTPAPPLPEPG